MAVVVMTKLTAVLLFAARLPTVQLSTLPTRVPPLI